MLIWQSVFKMDSRAETHYDILDIAESFNVIVNSFQLTSGFKIYHLFLYLIPCHVELFWGVIVIYTDSWTIALQNRGTTYWDKNMNVTFWVESVASWTGYLDVYIQYIWN